MALAAGDLELIAPTFDSAGGMSTAQPLTLFSSLGSLGRTWVLHRSAWRISLEDPSDAPEGGLFLSARLEPNGTLTLQGAGRPGGRYELEVATGLTPADWQPVQTAVADASGRLVFAGLPHEPAAARFYRLRFGA